MVYFSIGQKLALAVVSTAIIVHIPYLLEKLKIRSEEKQEDKLAKASRLTDQARDLLIKSKQIQEEFLLDDTTFAMPGPSSGKIFTSSIIGSKTTNESFNKKIDAMNYENVSFGEKSKRNVKERLERGENLVNTLFILGEDGEFVESIRFTDKDYADALNATQNKNKSNFMKNCFK